MLDGLYYADMTVNGVRYPVRWLWAQEGAKWISFPHSFGTSRQSWLGELDNPPEVGEVYEVHKRRAKPLVDDRPGDHLCGRQQYWTGWPVGTPPLDTGPGSEVKCCGGPDLSVQSVSLAMPPQFKVSGSPVTDVGGFVVSWFAFGPRLFLATPPLGGVPGLRAIQPLDLGTGTPDNTTFLRGDGTWAVPSGGSTINQGPGIAVDAPSPGTFVVSAEVGQGLWPAGQRFVKSRPSLMGGPVTYLYPAPPNNIFQLSFYMRVRNRSDTCSIMVAKSGSTYGWQVFSVSGLLLFYVLTPAGGGAPISVPMPANETWAFVECGWNSGTNDYWLSIDGGSRVHGTIAWVPGVPDTLHIGADPVAGVATVPFGGDIDEVMILNNDLQVERYDLLPNNGCGLLWSQVPCGFRQWMQEYWSLDEPLGPWVDYINGDALTIEFPVGSQTDYIDGICGMRAGCLPSVQNIIAGSNVTITGPVDLPTINVPSMPAPLITPGTLPPGVLLPPSQITPGTLPPGVIVQDQQWVRIDVAFTAIQAADVTVLTLQANEILSLGYVTITVPFTGLITTGANWGANLYLDDQGGTPNLLGSPDAVDTGVAVAAATRLFSSDTPTVLLALPKSGSLPGGGTWDLRFAHAPLPLGWICTGGQYTFWLLKGTLAP